MKKICSFIFMFFVLTAASLGETDINKIVAEMKKEFEIVNSKRNVKVEGNLENGTYTTYNLIQKDNIKKFIFGYYKDNTESYEEYYLKDNKVHYIFIEKTNYSFDNNNKNIVKIEKEEHKYYFDNNQKLIRYIAPDEKIYDMDKIPNNAKEKSEELKKNIKTYLNGENSKDVMAEMKKEFDDRNKEMMKKFDEMKKEMEDFFEKF